MTDDPLEALGFGAFFRRQVGAEDLATGILARVFAVQRSGLLLRGADGDCEVSLGGRWFQLDAALRPTVGDWLLLNERRDAVRRVLERKSLLKRSTPGRNDGVQLIAANVDTMFLLSSCNEEFNVDRLERYLALAHDAGVHPVVVLTKADLADEAEHYANLARGLGTRLSVETINGLDARSVACLGVWCAPGQTIALMGSSGVGKSTLLNTLAGRAIQVTGAVRSDDHTGRHTTTFRSLHLLPGGALLVDSPGMRELSVVDAETGVEAMFDDIEALASGCRFSDCEHQVEPECAVRTAIANGHLDERRLLSYLKLRQEGHQHLQSTVGRSGRKGKGRSDR